MNTILWINANNRIRMTISHNDKKLTNHLLQISNKLFTSIRANSHSGLRGEARNSALLLERCAPSRDHLIPSVESSMFFFQYTFFRIIPVLARCLFFRISHHVLWIFCSWATWHSWVWNFVIIQHKFVWASGYCICFLLLKPKVSEMQK